MRFTLDGEPFELSPELVRARLEGVVPENIRDYWVEIDGTRWPVKQVISVATRVADRQRFQSQSARRWLQNLGFTIGSGTATSSPRATPARDAGRPDQQDVTGKEIPPACGGCHGPTWCWCVASRASVITEPQPRTSTCLTTFRRCGTTPRHPAYRGSFSRLSTASYVQRTVESTVVVDEGATA
jgi:hypothetical protein